MNIRVSKEELQKRLSDIQSVVDKRATMPILGHFLLSVGEESYITATDLETAIKEPIGVLDIKERGDLCIPAKKLYEIVREMDGEIEIDSEGTEWIKLKTGKSLFRIACMNPEDFPKWPQFTDKITLEFEADKLHQMIDRTIYAAGESDTRYTLNSLLFHIKPGDKTFTIVGTDGHRLSMIKDSIDIDLDKEIKVIVPRKSASELRRFLAKGTKTKEAEETEGESQEVAESTGRVKIDVATNHVVFKTGDVEFLVRLIEGNYPNYEQVIPSANEKKVGINREVFMKALRRVSIISKDRSNAIKLDVSPGVLTITASNPDIGEAKDEIEIDYSGEAISLGFNARYLLDALNSMSSDRVIFELQEPLSPTLLKEEGRDDYLCVVMPMRI